MPVAAQRKLESSGFYYTFLPSRNDIIRLSTARQTNKHHNNTNGRRAQGKSASASRGVYKASMATIKAATVSRPRPKGQTNTAAILPHTKGHADQQDQPARKPHRPKHSLTDSPYPRQKLFAMPCHRQRDQQETGINDKK